jgi:hypothetical protein
MLLHPALFIHIFKWSKENIACLSASENPTIALHALPTLLYSNLILDASALGQKKLDEVRSVVSVQNALSPKETDFLCGDVNYWMGTSTAHSFGVDRRRSSRSFGCA